jgi:hypothetical protein
MEPILADIGIDKKESHRWQKHASTREPEFERHITQLSRASSALPANGCFQLLPTGTAMRIMIRASFIFGS